MDDLDRQLLLLLGRGVPLQARPFEVVGKSIGMHGADVLLRIQRLKERKIIREITAFFDSVKLGYRTALVVMRVAPEKLEQAVEALNTYPATAELVIRNHVFNLWLTMILPIQESLQAQLHELERISGAEKILELTPPTQSVPALEVKWAFREMEAIRVLQEDLPLTDEPFRVLAKRIGTSESDFLTLTQGLIQKGALRKIAAVVEKKNASAYSGAKVLSAWRIPEEKLDQIKDRLVRFPEVLKWMRRPTYPELPYSLHLTLKAANPKEAEEAAAAVEKRIGAWPHVVLETIREYPKRRLKYFSGNPIETAADAVHS